MPGPRELFTRADMSNESSEKPMRDEITEPQDWRRSSGSHSDDEASWSARRRTRSPLPAEAVDAALADDSVGVEPARGSRRDCVSHDSRTTVDHGVVAISADSHVDETVSRNDLVQSLSAQLAMLESQREQLQRLLARAHAGER